MDRRADPAGGSERGEVVRAFSSKSIATQDQHADASTESREYWYVREHLHTVSKDVSLRALYSTV